LKRQPDLFKAVVWASALNHAEREGLPEHSLLGDFRESLYQNQRFKWTGFTGFVKIDRIKNNGFYPVHPAKSC
jgi:hypothetical protein